MSLRKPTLIAVFWSELAKLTNWLIAAFCCELYPDGMLNQSPVLIIGTRCRSGRGAGHDYEVKLPRRERLDAGGAGRKVRRRRLGVYGARGRSRMGFCEGDGDAAARWVQATNGTRSRNHTPTKVSMPECSGRTRPYTSDPGAASSAPPLPTPQYTTQ